MKGNYFMANKSKAATELVYTESELAAIEVLKANHGTPLSAAELGVAPVILTGISRKADKFPGEGIVINKEDRQDVCPTCGHKRSYKVYWID